MVPMPGRIVLYRLTHADAEAINRRRKHACDSIDYHRWKKIGTQVHVGNAAGEGDEFPMTIVRVWGGTPTSAVNGQVMLDGNDTLWVTSVSVGEGPGTFRWPTRA